ncbi:MAG: STAS/SEC14 domain-containing protein [Sphingomonas sp.]
MHSVSLDRARKLLEVRMSGFVSLEDARAAAEELQNAIRSLGADAGHHLTLYDLSEVPIAPAETMALLQDTFANPRFRGLWARKVAFVTSSALGRLQLRRLERAEGELEIFDDRQSALAWLLA